MSVKSLTDIELGGAGRTSQTARSAQPAGDASSRSGTPHARSARARFAAGRPASRAGSRGTWSPAGYPDLRFEWSRVQSGNPVEPSFPTTVSLVSASDGAPLDPQDPRAKLVGTTLASDTPPVPFSVYDETGQSVVVQGVLNYEQGPSTGLLTVTDLAYPGGSIARQVLAGDPLPQSLPMYFPPGFDLPTARQCGEHVLAAYAQYEDWKQQLFPDRNRFIWKWPSNRYSYAPLWADIVIARRSHPEPFGFVAWDRAGNAFIVFRGTVTWADWSANVQIAQAEYPFVQNCGSVHVGFSSTYQSIGSALREQIDSIAGGITNLYFTGHSLGAALSTLAVADIINNTAIANSDASCVQYNFASPRVGDPTFADQMNHVFGAQTFRIVNSTDTVPGVPLAVLGVPLLGSLRYEHVGVPVEFTAEYSPVKNHSMANYQYAIEHPEQPQGPT